MVAGHHITPIEIESDFAILVKFVIHNCIELYPKYCLKPYGLVLSSYSYFCDVKSV